MASNDASNKIHVIHVITGLGVGGAEMMLYRLLRSTDRSKFDVEVVSLTSIGDVGKLIQACGIRVRALNMKRRRPNVFRLAKLVAWLMQAPRGVIHAWMYHSNLIATIASALSMRGHKIIWGIHQTTLTPDANSRTTLFVAKAATVFASLCTRIVCCADASKLAHAQLGYPANKMVTIGNGFDVDEYCPDLEGRASVRRELGITDETVLIGLIARFDPQKAHDVFFAAASLLHTEFPSVHFVLCGTHITYQNKAVTTLIDNARIRNVCHLLGQRNDIARIMTALDIVCLSSYSEAFPNVIGEAMAAGVPCVVTDVGDCASLLGEAGVVVPPQNAYALAQGLKALLLRSRAERASIGLSGRKRIVQYFSIAKVSADYCGLYAKIVDRKI